MSSFKPSGNIQKKESWSDKADFHETWYVASGTPVHH